VIPDHGRMIDALPLPGQAASRGPAGSEVRDEPPGPFDV
jgi:hypothetical protein